MEPLFNKLYVGTDLENITICQYIPLDYFINQLISGKYYVRRKDLFDDVNERTLPVNFLFVPTEVNVSHIINSRILYDRQQDKYNKYKELSKVFVSSWTMDVLSNHFMWKTYASTYGVCIFSSIENFIASFDSILVNNYDVHVSAVNYRNYNYTDTAEESLFIKKPLYRNEKEIRFIFAPKEFDEKSKDNILLPYKYSVMIDKVVLSPFWSYNTARFLKTCFEVNFGLRVLL